MLLFRAIILMHHISIYLHIAPEKKQRSLVDGAFLHWLKSTKSFRWSKTITEIGITRLSHGNSCIQKIECYPCRLQRKTLFTCLFVEISHALNLSRFPLCKIFLKRRGCLLNHQFQRVPFPFCQPQVIFTPSLHLPVPPPIQPSLSKRTLRANLYSLSHAKHLSCPHWMPLQSNQHLSGCKAF